MAKSCPRCGKDQNDLIKIEAGLRLRIQELNVDSEVPPEVCVNCFKEVSSEVSHGAKLRAEINAKEHNKRILWKNRVALVKSARERMAVKAFAEAAVLYEKYVRTLEISQDQPSGKLDPSLFNNPQQQKELTILASVYWDLIRIYDSNPSYSGRIDGLIRRLLEVLPMTPASGDIVNRAERFLRIANNDAAIKAFLKEARKSHGQKCFVATACFESPYANEVELLRQYRDQILIPTRFGRVFTNVYYYFSPALAKWLENQPKAKRFVRNILRPIALRLAAKYDLKSRS